MDTTLKQKIVVTCPKGITPFLRQELEYLGFPVIEEGIADIVTEGDLNDAMRLNLLLRTGHRVLLLIKEFEASDPEALYQTLTVVPWEHYIPENEFITVTSTVDTPTIRDQRYANLRCKDAIVDRFMKISGKRPDSGPERNGVVVHLFWKDERCAIYLDTSGEPLSKRVYRTIPLKAPMQGTLAAAVVMATGWNGKGNFVNPMCGSGTLAIEAAMIGLNIPPGLTREGFGFMHLKGYSATAWEQLVKEKKKEIRNSLEGRIIATDINPAAIKAAMKNATDAGVEKHILFSTAPFEATLLPEGSGVVIMNPEYGERMGKIQELETVYQGIGDFFKKRCRGFTGYVFTGNLELAKKIGLRTKRKMVFFNSGIECRLLEYELYEGSRKTSDKERGGGQA